MFSVPTDSQIAEKPESLDKSGKRSHQKMDTYRKTFFLILGKQEIFAKYGYIFPNIGKV